MRSLLPRARNVLFNIYISQDPSPSLLLLGQVLFGRKEKWVRTRMNVFHWTAVSNLEIFPEQPISRQKSILALTFKKWFIIEKEEPDVLNVC